MNTAKVQAEIKEAHEELAILLNTLINIPVNQRAEKVANNLAFDLKDELGKRLTSLKTDIKTVLEASEELEEGIEALQRGTARLEANANKHQEKHEERYQHLLNELSNVITIRVDNVIERLDHSQLQHFLKAHATLGNLSTRVDELQAGQTQIMVELSGAFGILSGQLLQAEVVRTKAIKKDASRFIWVIGAVTVNLLVGGSLLFHLFRW